MTCTSPVYKTGIKVLWDSKQNIGGGGGGGVCVCHPLQGGVLGTLIQNSKSTVGGLVNSAVFFLANSLL
jgi:hypothetical protein